MEYIREGNVLPVPFNILFLPKHVFNSIKTIIRYVQKKPKKSDLIQLQVKHSSQSIDQDTKLNRTQVCI